MTKHILFGLSSLSLVLIASPQASADCGASHASAGTQGATVATAALPTLLAVAEAGGFSTLAAAVEAAGLSETLSGPGPFTVFAPTNEAFAKLPAGTVEALLEDPEALRAILLHHVVAGTVKAADVVKLKSAKTAGGTTLAIVADKTGVKVAGATVTQTDIAASNGVIHVIDSVLLP
jgi:uncharacterized surface protein with fasciclin (FAS1) repeats